MPFFWVFTITILTLCYPPLNFEYLQFFKTFKVKFVLNLGHDEAREKIGIVISNTFIVFFAT